MKIGINLIYSFSRSCPFDHVKYSLVNEALITIIQEKIMGDSVYRVHGTL